MLTRIWSHWYLREDMSILTVEVMVSGVSSFRLTATSIFGKALTTMMKAISDTSYNHWLFKSSKTASMWLNAALSFLFNFMRQLESRVWSISSFTLLRLHSKCARMLEWFTLSLELSTSQRKWFLWDMLLLFFLSMTLPKNASWNPPNQSLLLKWEWIFKIGSRLLNWQSKLPQRRSSSFAESLHLKLRIKETQLRLKNFMRRLF